MYNGLHRSNGGVRPNELIWKVSVVIGFKLVSNYSRHIRDSFAINLQCVFNACLVNFRFIQKTASGHYQFIRNKCSINLKFICNPFSIQFELIRNVFLNDFQYQNTGTPELVSYKNEFVGT